MFWLVLLLLINHFKKTKKTRACVYGRFRVLEIGAGKDSSNYIIENINFISKETRIPMD